MKTSKPEASTSKVTLYDPEPPADYAEKMRAAVARRVSGRDVAVRQEATTRPSLDALPARQEEMRPVAIGRPRSDAQVAASRANGARSQGATTSLGKSASSANAIRTGVSAACVLMPGESLEERRAQLDSWAATFKPATPGEAWLAAKIADCMVRLDRLDTLVRAAEDAGVESALKKSDVYKKLSAAKDAHTAMQALAITAEGVNCDVDAGAVSRLTPAMRRCLELAEAAEVPMSVLVQLQDALNGVIVDTAIGVDAGTFQELGRAARMVETALAPIIERTAQEVETEKKRLALDPTLADEEMLRRLDRYRARLMREMDGLLRLLRQVRELAAPPGDDSGSFVHVELRVVGRANLAGS